MIGTIVNTACIIAGTLIGTQVKRGLNSKYSDVLFNAMGLVCIVLGVHTAGVNLEKSTFPVLFIISLAVGGLVGTKIDVEGRVRRLSERYSSAEATQGIITASLLFCIGTLSIVGPMLSALYGDNRYLYTNATLDFVSSMVLSAMYGYWIMVAGVVLFCWQGGIYLITRLCGDLLSGGLMAELSIVGGVLIICTGLQLLHIKECKTLNYLPALFVPPIYFLLRWGYIWVVGLF